MSNGGSLATKGLISGGGAAVVETVLAAPPAPAVIGETASPTGKVLIIVPTAPHICLMAAENITANLRVQQVSNLTLASLYKRAFLVAYETDEIAVVKPVT